MAKQQGESATLTGIEDWCILHYVSGMSLQCRFLLALTAKLIFSGGIYKYCAYIHLQSGRRFNLQSGYHYNDLKEIPDHKRSDEVCVQMGEVTPSLINLT